MATPGHIAWHMSGYVAVVTRPVTSRWYAGHFRGSINARGYQKVVRLCMKSSRMRISVHESENKMTEA